MDKFQTIQSFLTAGLLLATAIYAYLTWRIVKKTGDQIGLQQAANTALKEQAEAQKKQVELESFLKVVERMEETRADRAVIREYASANKGWQVMKADSKLQHLDRVCRAFDILGLLDRLGLVNPDLVDRFYAPPLVELWEKVAGSYVDELRKPENRGKTHFWELVAFYHRVRNVPRMHPGVTGSSDWPPHPRQVSGA